MSDRKLSEIVKHIRCAVSANTSEEAAIHQERAEALVAALEAEVERLSSRAALADKLTADEPDPEIADAVKIVEGVFDSLRPVDEHERAALNRLVNRASGVTVKRLQEELAEARTQALGVTGDALPERRQVKP